MLFVTACDEISSKDTKAITNNITSQVNKIVDTTPDPIVVNSSFDPPHTAELNLIKRADGQFDTPFDIKYKDPEGKVWIAPKGTITDGASIPDHFTTIFGGKMNPKHLRAAIVHDAYCGESNKGQSSFQKESWENTHRMYYKACLKNGTDKIRSGTMYAAVRLGGPRWTSDGKPISPLSGINKADLTKAVLECKAWIIKEGGSVNLDKLDAFLVQLEANLLKANS